MAPRHTYGSVAGWHSNLTVSETLNFSNKSTWELWTYLTKSVRYLTMSFYQYPHTSLEQLQCTKLEIWDIWFTSCSASSSAFEDAPAYN